VEEVVPLIDGREFADIVHEFERANAMETRAVSYGGLIPEFYKFEPLDRHFLGVAESVGTDGKVPVLGCECGEWGCWPLRVRIVVDGARVVWSEFEQPHRETRDYSGLGPFVFDASDYGKALRALGRSAQLR
jgi:hypothetical protein